MYGDQPPGGTYNVDRPAVCAVSGYDIMLQTMVITIFRSERDRDSASSL